MTTPMVMSSQPNTPLLAVSATDHDGDGEICESAKSYLYALIIVGIFMLLALFLFDVTGKMNPAIFADDLENDPEQYRLKSLYMELGGWGAFVLGGASLGFFLGRKATLGNIEFFESKLTKCPGIAYAVIMILIIVIIIVVTYLNDPFNIWHKWSYGTIDTGDPCDARLYEKHRKDFEIGGWATMIFGSLLIGGMMGYAHFYGRKRLNE